MWWPSTSDNVSQDSTVGVYLLSTIFAAMFYGLTFLQNLQYLDRFRRDSAAMKFLVLVLWLFDSTSMALLMQAVYMFAVARRGITFAAIAVPGSVEVERIFAFAVVFMVQMFFTGRIWYLGGRHWYTATFIGVVATVALITGIAAAAEASAYGVSNPSHPVSADGLSLAAAAFQIIAGVLIVAGQYWFGAKCKLDQSRSSFRDAIVNLVNRGVLSALMLLLTTITYSAARPQLVWVAFHMSSSKVHAMSLLSTLNTRELVDGEGHDTEVEDARLRDRIERELRRGALPEEPPVIPSMHNLRSQSSWFNSHAKRTGSDTDGDDKSAAGMTTISALDPSAASASVLSRGPSVHARSTTAVDGY